MGRAKKFVTRLKKGAKVARNLETVLINQGRILTKLNEIGGSSNPHHHEFKIFSQFGEDGILQFLTNNLEIANKTFIEFGIETFEESNCRFLMMKDIWRGFVIDGSQDNLDYLRSTYYYFQYQLESECAFIDQVSINGLLEKSGFGHNPGIISVDIDGVDYHIFEVMSEWRPDIYIFEYNSIFGSKLPVSVPYDPKFVRLKKHHSNQYWGASLGAFAHLANERGYALVATTQTGQNCFFVRRELLNDRVKEMSVEEAFTDMCFRDSRNEKGELTLASGSSRRELISDMQLVNVVTGKELTVSELPPELHSGVTI